MSHAFGAAFDNPGLIVACVIGDGIEGEELEQYLRGCGWTPRFVEGHDPDTMQELVATAVDWAIEELLHDLAQG